jgi:preprotein translocase subunit YajC
MPAGTGPRQSLHRRHCIHRLRRYNRRNLAALRGFASFRRLERFLPWSTAIFITPALAQTAGAVPGGYDQILQYVTLFGPILIIMYFMVLRPQQKRAKDQADLIKNIRRGDSIVTTGGLIGRVTKVVDDANELEVEIAPNVRVRVSRPMVVDVRAKGEPVKDAG